MRKKVNNALKKILIIYGGILLILAIINLRLTTGIKCFNLFSRLAKANFFKG